jgi:hypothetical protein
VSAHGPPCETWEQHVYRAALRHEDSPPADFLARFDQEREEEEQLVERERRLARRRQVRARSEGARG